MSPLEHTARRRGAAALVAGAGLLAGALDIAYACAYWAVKNGTPPSRIFQSVAAGLLGSAAFSGGPATAALGLTLHFGIAMTIAVVYYAAARNRTVLWRRPWLFGALYGLLVYGVMNYVVVPLSAAGAGGGTPDRLWITLTVIVHVIFIGIPCALAARAALAPHASRPAQ